MKVKKMATAIVDYVRATWKPDAEQCAFIRELNALYKKYGVVVGEFCGNPQLRKASPAEIKRHIAYMKLWKIKDRPPPP